MKNRPTSYELAVIAANMAEDKKAKDITLLMTEEVSTLTDYFVIASVESRTQMRALADHFVKELRQRNIHTVGQQIDPSGRWSVIDFGEVVIHIFHQEDRAFYSLERFWNHATEIPQSRWSQDQRQAS